MKMKYSFLDKYKRITTIKICEGKLFEDIFTDDCDTALSLMRNIIHKLMIECVWQVYIVGIENDEVVVHLDVNKDFKEFKVMIFLSVKACKRLFGNLVPEQRSKELHKIVVFIEKEVNKIDWPQFILDVD